MVYGLAKLAEHVGNGRGLRRLRSLVRIVEGEGEGLGIDDLGCEAEACVGGAQCPCEGETTCGGLTGKGFLHDLVLIAIKRCARTQFCGDGAQIKVVTLGAVDAESYACRGDEAISAGKRGGTTYHDVVTSYLFDCAYALAYALGGGEGAEVGSAALHEIVCIAAVEGAVNVGGEGVLVYALRAALIVGAAAAHDGVELLTIPCCDVFDVGYVFETPFNLERGDSCVEEGFEIVRAVHVAHTQEVALGEKAVVAGEETIWHTAELGALSAICAAIVADLGGIAASVVADADGSVDEDFEGHRGDGLVYAANLVDGELACEDGLLVAL